MTAKTIADAIRESVQTNRTVDIAVYTDAQLDAVICEADDYFDNGYGTVDAWGTTDEGHEWRLFVKIAY